MDNFHYSIDSSGLSPSSVLTLAALLGLSAFLCCGALGIYELFWRSAYLAALSSYALPALASALAYYAAPATCASITALPAADVPSVVLLGAVLYALLVRHCAATGAALRAALRGSLLRKAFGALLLLSLLSSAAAHSAVALLAARWGMEATVASRPASLWEGSSAGMALVVFGDSARGEPRDGGAPDAALWWQSAPPTCTVLFAGAALALRAGSVAAVLWGALRGGAGEAGKRD